MLVDMLSGGKKGSCGISVICVCIRKIVTQALGLVHSRDVFIYRFINYWDTATI